MSVDKKHFGRFLFVFVISSFFYGLPSGFSSTLDWNRWFSQFSDVSQPAISDDGDKSLYSQEKVTSQNGRDSKLSDWFTVSANLDSSYRNTNFYESGHHTIISQGDSRLELWMPPNRREFSWGPYIRFAGLTSDHSQAWENAWLAQPGFGVQVYPFSAANFRKENEKAANILGPVRLFAEHNRMDYWGSENVWRPDEQFRAGADYWKALYVNDTSKPQWAEIWSGLFWQSANEFDKDYDSLILGNAVRVGLRKTKAGHLSNFTPYLTLESSLTENRSYYWENRLWLGGGIRFAPRLYERENESNWLTRFVVYAEYLGVASYYRDSAPSSVPDYDLRIGVSLSIGEWYR
ncbi:MAG: hypothetical protein JXM79_24560 [Sedimentisphaerales bacterium]|nr:hypothetical protein [Sedimentisphaerales bacterium]